MRHLLISQDVHTSTIKISHYIFLYNKIKEYFFLHKNIHQYPFLQFKKETCEKYHNSVKNSWWEWWDNHGDLALVT